MTVTLKVKRGDTWEFECTRTDANGDPVDLTGTTIAATMKDGATTVSLTPTITSAVDGQFTLKKLPADTINVTPAAYLIDIEFTDSGGAVQSTKTFVILVDEDITNAP